MMKRDINQLGSQKFDVVIIGGGIYGAAIARESAKSGLKTALIEKTDFAHATSANSLKILHGGLRYLQHLDFRRMRDSICARRDLMQTAPHLVKPLGCVIPLYGYGLRSREAMGTALFLNDLISQDRNLGLLPEKQLPAGKILSPKACQNIVPGINPKGLRGAALWHDALAVNTERLVLSLIHEASAYGACVANYVGATDLMISQSRVNGVAAFDLAGQHHFDIRTSTVINTAGPWFEGLLSRLKIQKQAWAKSLNIIVKKSIFKDFAVGLEGTAVHKDEGAVLQKGKRFYFFVPWRGYTMIGTTYELCPDHPDHLKAQAQDIKKMLGEVNDIYPDADINFEDVTFYHAGLMPVSKTSASNGGDIQPEKHTQIIDHEMRDGIKGVISVKGVKYTTATQTAKVLIRRLLGPKQSLLERLGLKNKATQNFFDTHQTGGFPHLDKTYGPQSKNVADYFGKEPEWISKDSPFMAAEVMYAMHEEMALSLSDVIFRRTDLGTAECPSLEILDQAAQIMAQELGWDKARKAEEIAWVLKRYKPLKSINLET